MNAITFVCWSVGFSLSSLTWLVIALILIFSQFSFRKWKDNGEKYLIQSFRLHG